MFIKKLYKKSKSSLKLKLILFIIPITMIPIILFSLIIANMYDNAMTRRTVQNVEDSNMVIADRITRVFMDSENCANYLTVNINRIFAGQYKTIGNLNQVVINRLIGNELNSAQVVFQEIESITFLGEDGNVSYSDYRLMNHMDKIEQSEYFEQLTQTSGQSLWFQATVRDFLVTDEESKTLTLGKKVISTITGETLGYLFVNVDIKEITKHMDSQLISYWLVDSKDSILTPVTESDILTQVDGITWLDSGVQSDIKKTGGSRYLLTKRGIGGYDWTLLGITDLNKFNVEAKEIVTLTMLIVLSVVVLVAIMSIVFSTIITAPLVRLKAGAEQVAEGNLDIRFHFRTEDEIGRLGQSFNYMTQRVQELLKKVDYEANKKREYELSLLHQQVKPHFLYNTLDIIIKLSAMNKNREAQRVAKKLADYYRGSLSNNKDVIPIGEEIQITKDYLELQKMRYLDLFEYDVEVDPQILGVPILKLTLQPLVENAIYHGLKYKEGKGHLHIRGEAVGDVVELHVIDDGIGMNKEEQDMPNIKAKNDKHFGVYSVNHRIKLYFGEEYGLDFTSEYGVGTDVKVTVPKIREEQEESDD